MEVTCGACGRAPSDEESAAVSWTTSRERGRLRRYCPACARDHLRAMEAKLDSEWW